MGWGEEVNSLKWQACIILQRIQARIWEQLNWVSLAQGLLRVMVWVSVRATAV